MSSNVTSPAKRNEPREPGVASSPSALKAKAKATDNSPQQDSEQEGDDDDDDDDDEMGSGDEEEEEDEDDEDDYGEIDPTAIRSRRTRGKRVDYTSKEALQKAGLDGAAEEDEDEVMKE